MPADTSRFRSEERNPFGVDYPRSRSAQDDESIQGEGIGVFRTAVPESLQLRLGWLPQTHSMG